MGDDTSAGFAAGSIPFGLIIGKRLGVDIREKGSGNIGASNVTRVLGLIPGLVVALLDIAKGALPVLIARKYGGVATMVGWAAILGHCFSPWLGGKGGKGVATAFGVFLVVAPLSAVVAVIVFGAVLAITRIPTPSARFATAEPIRPQPMMPSVRPVSRKIGPSGATYSPLRIRSCAQTIRRAMAKSNAIACSATSWVQ